MRFKPSAKSILRGLKFGEAVTGEKLIDSLATDLTTKADDQRRGNPSQRRPQGTSPALMLLVGCPGDHPSCPFASPVSFMSVSLAVLLASIELQSSVGATPMFC